MNPTITFRDDDGSLVRVETSGIPYLPGVDLALDSSGEGWGWTWTHLRSGVALVSARLPFPEHSLAHDAKAILRPIDWQRPLVEIAADRAALEILAFLRDYAAAEGLRVLSGQHGLTRAEIEGMP